jgi:exodeoxyribonuclease V beta subunit
LPARRWSGFLAGFVDMVFEHRGRWHVLDWKSNHLGNRGQDYGASSLWAAMLEHHYVLQYHLYVVALHRYLRLRLSDYDYDRHVGGAHYVFLRGLSPEGERGWWSDRPPRPLIVALDRWLGGWDPSP